MIITDNLVELFEGLQGEWVEEINPEDHQEPRKIKFTDRKMEIWANNTLKEIMPKIENLAAITPGIGITGQNASSETIWQFEIKEYSLRVILEKLERDSKLLFMKPVRVGNADPENISFKKN